MTFVYMMTVPIWARVVGSYETCWGWMCLEICRAQLGLSARGDFVVIVPSTDGWMCGGLIRGLRLRRIP